MDMVKKKWKKNMVSKVWERCRRTITSSNVGEQGCFSVYVGPQRQRFMVKTELTKHPLFQMLLEDAELEYGFTNEGPLLLPCDVDLFNRVLSEINNNNGDHHRDQLCSSNSSFACSPLILCSPSRRSSMNKVYGAAAGSYKLLTEYA